MGHITLMQHLANGAYQQFAPSKGTRDFALRIIGSLNLYRQWVSVNAGSYVLWDFLTEPYFLLGFKYIIKYICLNRGHFVNFYPLEKRLFCRLLFTFSPFFYPFMSLITFFNCLLATKTLIFKVPFINYACVQECCKKENDKLSLWCKRSNYVYTQNYKVYAWCFVRVLM